MSVIAFALRTCPVLGLTTPTLCVGQRKGHCFTVQHSPASCCCLLATRSEASSVSVLAARCGRLGRNYSNKTLRTEPAHFLMLKCMKDKKCSLFYPEDGSSMFLRGLRIYLPNYTASYSRRQPQPQISTQIFPFKEIKNEHVIKTGETVKCT
jgi:hypothetical protein